MMRLLTWIVDAIYVISQGEEAVRARAAFLGIQYLHPCSDVVKWASH